MFGPGARVRLFGSRLDDAGRGGDMDLLVEVDEVLPDRVLRAAEMEGRLMLALGERKIDVLVKDPVTPCSGVIAVAAATGRLLG